MHYAAWTMARDKDKDKYNNCGGLQLYLPSWGIQMGEMMELRTAGLS